MQDMQTAAPNEKIEPGFQPFILAGPVLLLLYLVIRRAWLSDDAYITFRTIDNFIHGNGLVWNVGERVQSYTHPLWMFLLTPFHALTGEVYFSTLLLSIGLTLAAVMLLFRVKATTGFGLLAVTVLVLSNAFVDYATSGLENPLSYFLVALFFTLHLTAGFKNKLLILSLILALVGLNRIDLMLMCLPAWILALNRKPDWKLIKTILLGFSPLIVWELFSLFYYGFLFPNTAYAKLNSGYPLTLFLSQGLAYFINSLQVDPVTLFAILFSLVAAVLSKKLELMAIGTGIILYLLYIIYIGGDFMSGRFFSVPLLAAVIIITRMPATLIPGKTAYPVVAAVLMLAFLAGTPGSTVYVSQPEPRVDRRGINDERLSYYESNGLLAYQRGKTYPDSNWCRDGIETARSGKTLLLLDSIGMFSYCAGPGVKVVDQLALTDAFLARLPAMDNPSWRIGHMRREVPAGYMLSLRVGKNKIEDPGLAKYYDAIQTIISGPLFSPQRLRTIWEMNTGKYRPLVDG